MKLKRETFFVPDIFVQSLIDIVSYYAKRVTFKVLLRYNRDYGAFYNTT